MIFGLTFQCGGETGQIRITEDTKLQYRVTSGGEWQGWKTAIDSVPDEVASQCETAKRLASPVKITFTKDAEGSVSFDGSEKNVECALSVTESCMESVLLNHLKKYHTNDFWAGVSKYYYTHHELPPYVSNDEWLAWQNNQSGDLWTDGE